MKILMVLSGLFLLSSCTTQDVQVDGGIADRSLLEDEYESGLREAYPPSYVRMISSGDRSLSEKVHINAPRITLLDVLRAGFGKDVKIVEEGPDVDLGLRLSMYAIDMRRDLFLKKLVGMTGLDFRFENDVLYISKMARRKFSIPTLASVSSFQGDVGGGSESSDEDGGGGESSGRGDLGVSLESSTDGWEPLIEEIEAILGVDDSDQSDGETTVTDVDSAFGLEEFLPLNVPARGLRASVSGIRSQGLIYAVGDPIRMQVVDQMMEDLIYQSERLIHLDVKAYEVSLSDQRGRGIDWNLLAKNIATLNNGGTVFDLEIGGDVERAEDVGSSNVFEFELTGRSGAERRASFVFDFLEQFGRVKLLSEPNLTTTNGHPAYISAGEELSYVASVEQTLDAQGQVTVTPELERLVVGVTMGLIPRITGDGLIVIDVIPILSALRGFTNLTIGGNTIATPNTPLRELATQVIVRPGETIQLGGIITSRLSEAINRLPSSEKGGFAHGITDLLFSSEANEVERAEFVMTITPTIVSAQ